MVSTSALISVALSNQAQKVLVVPPWLKLEHHSMLLFISNLTGVSDIGLLSICKPPQTSTVVLLITHLKMTPMSHSTHTKMSLINELLVPLVSVVVAIAITFVLMTLPSAQSLLLAVLHVPMLLVPNAMIS